MADTEKTGAPEWPEQLEEQAQKSVGAPRERHMFDSGCPHCGALLPEGVAACLVCGAKRGGKPYEGVFPVPSAEPAPTLVPPPDQAELRAARAAPTRWRRWFGGLACAIVVAVIGLGALYIYQQYFDTGSFRADEAVVYQNNQGVLMLTHPGLEAPLTVTGAVATGGSFAHSRVSHSPNGRWLSCADSDSRLYRIDLAQGGADAVLVASDFQGDALFSQNSEFLLYCNSQGELYASDLSDRWRLDTGVADILAADSRKVLYTRRGDSGQLDLYLNELRPTGGEWLIIDRGVEQVLDWTAGFEKILYTTAGPQQEGARTFDLHRFEMGEAGKSSTSILVDGIGQVLDASAERGVVVYLNTLPQSWRYEDFIDDDLALADAGMREPDLADYPLVAEVVAIYGEGADYSDTADNEELVEQLGKYSEDQKAWEDKQARDELRVQLRESFAAISQPLALSELWIYQGGKAEQVDSGVWQRDSLTAEQGHVSALQGYVVYEKFYPDTLYKQKLSMLWSGSAYLGDPFHYFMNNTRRELIFSRFDSDPVQLFLRTDENSFIQWRAAPNADGAYFLAGPDGAANSTLYYTPLDSPSPDPVVVAREVRNIGAPLRNGVLYWSGSGESSSLCFTAGQNARVLAGSGAEVFPPVNGGETLLYLERQGSGDSTGDLYLFGKEQTLVAGAVSGCLYRSDDLIYLLRPSQSGGAAHDLYCWQGGRESLVGHDVIPLAAAPEVKR